MQHARTKGLKQKANTQTREKQKETHLQTKTTNDTHTTVSSADKFSEHKSTRKTNTHAKQNMNATHTHVQKNSNKKQTHIHVKTKRNAPQKNTINDTHRRVVSRQNF